MTEAPVDAWELVRSRARPRMVVPLPSPSAQPSDARINVAIQVLSVEQEMAAIISADRFAMEMLKVPGERRGYEDLYKSAAAIEVLHRACMHDETPSRAMFPSPKAMRETLTLGQLGALMTLYLTAQNDLAGDELKVRES